MSTQINDGGPAFPVAEIFDERTGNYTQYASDGMSLRDYFAAKAMQVALSQCSSFPDEGWRVGVALDAYAMADAMLKARGKGGAA